MFREIKRQVLLMISFLMRLTYNCFLHRRLSLPVFADFLWADVHCLTHVYYDSTAAKSCAA
jgi:hypothetical protein